MQQQHGRHVITQDLINGILVQLQQERQQLEAAVERFKTKTTTITKHFDNAITLTNKNINRIAIQPPSMALSEQQQYNNDHFVNEQNIQFNQAAKLS